MNNLTEAVDAFLAQLPPAPGGMWSIWWWRPDGVDQARIPGAELHAYLRAAAWEGFCLALDPAQARALVWEGPDEAPSWPDGTAPTRCWMGIQA